MVDTAKPRFPDDMTQVSRFPEPQDLGSFATDALDRAKQYARDEPSVVRALDLRDRFRPWLEAEALVIGRPRSPGQDVPRSTHRLALSGTSTRDRNRPCPRSSTPTRPGRRRSLRSWRRARSWAEGGSVLAFHNLSGEDYGPSRGVAELQAGLPSLLVVVDIGRVAGRPQPTGGGRPSPGGRHPGPHRSRWAIRRISPSGSGNYDAWMALGSVEGELPGRVAGMLDRAHQRSSGRTKLPTVDSRFLAGGHPRPADPVECDRPDDPGDRPDGPQPEPRARRRPGVPPG